MKGETQDGPERSSRGVGWVWLCWLGGILLFYVLSSGPALMMVNKKIIRGSSACRLFNAVYRPMDWISDEPLLIRPIRVYWHFWVPEWYDRKGNPKAPE